MKYYTGYTYLPYVESGINEIPYVIQKAGEGTRFPGTGS